MSLLIQWEVKCVTNYIQVNSVHISLYKKVCIRLRMCLFFLILLYFSYIASSNSMAVTFSGLDLQLHEQTVGMSRLHTDITTHGKNTQFSSLERRFNMQSEQAII